MCFSGELSGVFALVGLFCSWWVYHRTSNRELAAGIFFFFAMELLQFVQYFFIAENLLSPVCETTINKVLTVLGMLLNTEALTFLNSVKNYTNHASQRLCTHLRAAVFLSCYQCIPNQEPEVPRSLRCHKGTYRLSVNTLIFEKKADNSY